MNTFVRSQFRISTSRVSTILNKKVAFMNKGIFKFCFLGWIGVASVAFGGDYIPAQGPAIEGQFIVVLKDEVPSPEAREGILKSLVASQGGSLKRVFRQVLNGGIIRMNGARAEALARHPWVAYVEQDSTVTASTVQMSAPWGLDRIDQTDLPLNLTFNSTKAD